MGLQANWWLNAPTVNGWPTYLTAAMLDRNYNQLDGGAVPGSTASMAIEAYLKYFAYTGDARYLQMAKTIGTYVVQQALTPATYAAFPRFPWPAGATGDVTPDGSGHPYNDAGNVMPDKGAMIGMALLRLYEASGDATYRDAAVHIADVLANTAVAGTSAQSPWPFRVRGNSGTMVESPLMGNQVFALRLFDELLRLGISGNGQYQATRDTVWTWLKNVAIADASGDTWLHFFEDHSGSEYNPTQFDALETARYLLEKKNALDPAWFSMVTSIIDLVKQRWVVHSGDYTAIGEQQQDLSPYNSHTARYASILAMFSEAGGPAADKDEAYSSFAYSTYSVDDGGFADTYFDRGIAWSTDSFGDWMNHFMDGLGAVPEWAPGNSSHILRSSSMIQSVSYVDRLVQYVAFDPTGSEKLKLDFTPALVRVDGSPTSSWSWDTAKQVLAITRTNGSVVEIVGEGITPDTTPPSTPTDLTATTVSSSQINLAWTASTDDVGVTGYRLERCQGMACSDFSQLASPSGTTYSDTGLLAATSYSYRVRATDAAGNLSSYSDRASATTDVLPLPDTTPPTAPSNLTAAAVSSSQIDLAWTASTDDVGVSGYRVERCQGAGCSDFTQVATPSGTTYSDPGLLPATSYSYRVRATDAASNVSPYSNTASATTDAAQASGLVAAYSFNAGAGDQVADASGNGNTGTISGASWTTQGKFAYALSFDGVDDWVTVTDAASLDLTTGMTLEAWVLPTASGAWRTVVLKEQTGHLAYAMYANTDTDRPSGEVFTTSSSNVRGSAALPLDVWTHLAVTYDGAALTVYVDGTQVASLPVSGSIVTSTGALRIGGNTVWGEYFQGLIDEIRIYNRALTAGEIQTDMTTPVEP
jgi:chitodextrinase